MLGRIDLSAVDLFYGHSARTISTWCSVSIETARAYKRGRKPSASALRLFVLHRDERVLGVGWEGWSVRRDRIVDPDGNVTSELLLRHYAMVMQFARHLARDHSPEAHTEFYKLLSAHSAVGERGNSLAGLSGSLGTEVNAARDGRAKGQGRPEPPRLPSLVAKLAEADAA